MNDDSGESAVEDEVAGVGRDEIVAITAEFENGKTAERKCDNRM